MFRWVIRFEAGTYFQGDDHTGRDQYGPRASAFRFTQKGAERRARTFRQDNYIVHVEEIQE